VEDMALVMVAACAWKAGRNELCGGLNLCRNRGWEVIISYVF